LILEREQYYLDSLKPQYNILKVAGSPLGTKHSEETKAALMSIRKLGSNHPRGFLGKSHSIEKKRLFSSTNYKYTFSFKLIIINTP
jgi:group I intron endonuclease